MKSHDFDGIDEATFTSLPPAPSDSSCNEEDADGYSSLVRGECDHRANRISRKGPTLYPSWTELLSASLLCEVRGVRRFRGNRQSLERRPLDHVQGQRNSDSRGRSLA